jgi:cytoskeletal protein CcmA (bactofilin family)
MAICYSDRRRPRKHLERSTRRKETIMSSTPGAMLQTPESRGSAVIGKSVTIKGEIFSREDLTIDGEVDGSVELHEHRLTVGQNGKLRVDVRAHEVIVLGSIDGDVEATEKINIRKHARINGHIVAARIETEDGAFLKGSVDTQRRKVSHPVPSHLEGAFRFLPDRQVEE